MKRTTLPASALLGLVFAAGLALPGRPAEAWKFPCPENEIASYTAYRVSDPIQVDGRLEESAWKSAPFSPRFVDILTGGRTLHDTRAAVLWDEQNLYVGFRIEEPLVRAKYTNHNDPIYYDNDVEVFIAGRDAYYEFEINAFNTVYEAFFIWKNVYDPGGFAQAPGLDPARLTPFNGVGFTNHPRGLRLGAFQWTFPGKQTAVAIDGTVNKDGDRDRGWSVELAFPWKGMEWLAQADGRLLPPQEGDLWRMDFSRFNSYKEAPPARDSGGWVWTRHGIWDSHIPECFVRVRFSTNDVRRAPQFETPPVGRIPEADELFPGAGPVRRYDWFRNLWRQKRVGWAQRLELDRGAVVFLGDSITQGWGDNLGNSFPHLKTANRGISGDTSRGVLYRLQEDVLVLDPRAVVLLIGTNDLEEHAEPETIAGNVKLILGALARHNPAMPVVVCQLMPSSASMRRPAEKISRTNQLIAEQARLHPRAVLCDTWTLFADSRGDARKEEFPDLLHPNAAGYRKWADALRPIFQQLGLGSP